MVNGAAGHSELSAAKHLQRDLKYQPSAYYGGECLTLYYNRLQRDGWTLRSGDHHGAALCEKELPNSWVLRSVQPSRCRRLK